MDKPRHFQRTFWSAVGDLQRLDAEVNGWLERMGAEGYDIVSRDQVVNESGVHIVYCMTKAGSDFLRCGLLEKKNKVLELAFRHKETLVDVLAEAEQAGRPVTWESLVGSLRGGGK